MMESGHKSEGSFQPKLNVVEKSFTLVSSMFTVVYRL